MCSTIIQETRVDFQEAYVNITLLSFKIFLHIRDTLARTAYDLAEDEETALVITTFQENERMAKMQRQANIRSKIWKSQKLLKKGIKPKPSNEDNAS